jgi:hypothetical protein
VTLDRYFLRYAADSPYGARWPSIRYPARRNVSREQAEHMRAAMPNPDWFEIAEEPAT